MKKYPIYYNFENPTYEQIKNKQKELKAKISYDYNDLIEKYNFLLYSFNANDFQNLILESKKILLRYLEEIFKFFPQLQIIPISIFLNGSYAKEFNRPHSDIDINFVYPNKYKNDIFPIEEIINYIIIDLFNLKTRDKIHNMLQLGFNENYRMEHSNFQFYNIIFSNGKILNYKVRKTKKHIVELMRASDRSLGAFLNYLKDGIISKNIKEWCYSFCTINNYDDYNIKEKIIKIKKENFKINIEDNIKIQFNKINQVKNLNINSKYFIQDLNKNIKVNIPEIIQVFLIIFNELECHMDLIEFNKISSKLPIKLKNLILKYYWFLMRVEDICYSNKIDFSHRSIDNITYKEFNSLYEQRYKINFIKEKNDIINSLFNEIKNYYERNIKYGKNSCYLTNKASSKN